MKVVNRMQLRLNRNESSEQNGKDETGMKVMNTEQDVKDETGMKVMNTEQDVKDETDMKV